MKQQPPERSLLLCAYKQLQFAHYKKEIQALVPPWGMVTEEATRVARGVATRLQEQVACHDLLRAATRAAVWQSAGRRGGPPRRTTS